MPPRQNAIAAPPVRLWSVPPAATAVLPSAFEVRYEALSAALRVLHVWTHWPVDAFQIRLWFFPPPVTVVLPSAFEVQCEALSAARRVLHVWTHWPVDAFQSRPSEFEHFRRSQPWGLAEPCTELPPGWLL
jgi:hypothetical protein